MSNTKREVKAILGYVRIAPRKVGVIADEIRGKGINEALSFLQFSPRRRTSMALATLLKSAVANAEQKGTVDVDNLVIKSLLVGKGMTLKRFRPRAKGSAFPIQKRTSNVTVILAEK